jgi:hypothetical protein
LNRQRCNLPFTIRLYRGKSQLSLPNLPSAQAANPKQSLIIKNDQFRKDQTQPGGCCFEVQPA